MIQTVKFISQQVTDFTKNLVYIHNDVWIIYESIYSTWQMGSNIILIITQLEARWAEVLKVPGSIPGMVRSFQRILLLGPGVFKASN